MNFKQHNLMMYVEVESDLGENISSVQNITFFNHLILWDLGPCSRVGRRLLFVIIKSQEDWAQAHGTMCQVKNTLWQVKKVKCP